MNALYPVAPPLDLAPIASEIDRQFGRRLREFSIDAEEHGLVLSGVAPSFYVKQLAQHAVGQMTETPIARNDIQFYNPVIVRWMIEWMHPEWAHKAAWVSVSQLNPFFMAGWVGMLITGLNMLPVSQLDGGHTIYGLFGRDAYKIARAFIIVAIVYMIMYLEQAAIWTPMLILVILLGIHHPPTADDSVELDDFRWILGVASMAIPVLCFPLQALKQ